MSKYNKGFSLVELSVSILIIALLVAGITTGTKLVKQAKLRSVIAEFEEIKIAYNTFQSSFNATPGDMRDASIFFSGCATGGAGNVNCNGNGDGYVTFNMGGSYDGDQIGDEPSKVFRHMNLADIYKGGGSIELINTYSSFGSFAADGIHAASQAITGAYYIVSNVDGGGTGGSTQAAGTIYHNGATALTSNFDSLDNAVFLFELADPADTNPGGIGKIDALSVYQIDQKIDDGVTDGTNAVGANTGSFRVITDITGANACITGANYNTAQTASTCVPGLLLD